MQRERVVTSPRGNYINPLRERLSSLEYVCVHTRSRFLRDICIARAEIHLKKSQRAPHSE